MTTPDNTATITQRRDRHVETPHGRSSHRAPRRGSPIAALFPNPSVHLLPGAGHWPQHDQPDAVAELLKAGETA